MSPVSAPWRSLPPRPPDRFDVVRPHHPAAAATLRRGRLIVCISTDSAKAKCTQSIRISRPRRGFGRSMIVCPRQRHTINAHNRLRRMLRPRNIPLAPAADPPAGRRKQRPLSMYGHLAGPLVASIRAIRQFFLAGVWPAQPEGRHISAHGASRGILVATWQRAPSGGRHIACGRLCRPRGATMARRS